MASRNLTAPDGHGPTMRAITLRVSPEQGWFGPFHRGVAESPELALRALHELRLLEDGSTVMLYEYEGDRSAAAALADEHLGAEGEAWQTGRIDGAEWMFAHAEPSGLVGSLLALLGRFRVAVEWPVRFPTDGAALATLVGGDEELDRALDAVPESVSIRLERTGEYRSEPDRLAAGLTERERHTLATAVDLGYYRNPREANYEDVAAALECSTGTVGEHLRNAEAKVMGALLGGEPSPADARQPVTR